MKITFDKLEKINLSDYTTYVKENIPRHILFAPKAELIVFECLKLINYRNLNNSYDSVFKYARKTLKALGKPLNLELIKGDPIRSYILIVFDFKKLPIEQKLCLEYEVKSDLLKLDLLIQRYESDPFIQKYISKRINPRNHIQKTKAVFYNRAIKKKKSILDYMFQKLEDRAIEKSLMKYNKRLHEIMKRFESHYDFPYRDLSIERKGKISYELNYEKIDYEKINPMRNKINIMNFKCDISNGYTQESNMEILKRINGIDRLQKTHSKLLKLPIVNERKEIFNELITLYKKRLWYGFYALGLPQVEGIFSEMLKIAQPKAKQSTLSDKVNAVRPFIESSEYAFDYYEYYLPNQRNKFAHSGYDQDIETKCKYLVLDLQHIINSVEKIKSPLIELNQIINTGINYFIHIGHYSRILYLIDDLKSTKQLELINSQLNKFVYDTLIPNIALSDLLDRLEGDFLSALTSFKETFNLVLLRKLKLGIDLSTISNQKLISRLADIQEVLDDDSSILFMDDFKLLMDTYKFIRGFPNNFKKLNDMNKDLFNSFANKNKPIFEKLQILNSKIKVEFELEFILRKDDLKHITEQSMNP